MFRLAHISDPHIGPLPRIKFHELASKRITGFVNWQRNRRKQLFGNTLELLIEDIERLKPDHLALTGDIINLAADLEVEASKLWLESFADPRNVSVVPGNHDAYVPGALMHVLNAWRPYMIGDNHHPAWETADQIFPYLRVRDNVALIGVSTATASPPFMASGYFGRSQARRLANLLQETGERGLFRVIMIHHPPIRGATPNYKRMIGIRRFAAALSLGGAELVLHGHTHLNTLFWLDGRDGRVPVMGISSASQGHGGHKPAAGYNLFHIDGERGDWRLLRERFALARDDKTFEIVESSDFSRVSA
jgi:3',5'-cyclic AMP phosphodiesterase CpdA